MIPEEEPNIAKLDAQMLKAGFPARAIRCQKSAHGPALKKCEELKDYVMKDGIILLLGPTGRGKTVMATWWARYRQLQRKPCGQFITAYNLFMQVKCTFSGRKSRVGEHSGKDLPVDQETLTKRWSETPFLVIDEMQTRTGNIWEDGILEEIINNRYGAELPTVMIANLKEDEAAAMLGPRIMDRASECGGKVPCNWPSYRP